MGGSMIDLANIPHLKGQHIVPIPTWVLVAVETSNSEIFKLNILLFADIWFNTWSFSWICTRKGRPYGTHRSMYCQLAWSGRITQVSSYMQLAKIL